MGRLVVYLALAGATLAWAAVSTSRSADRDAGRRMAEIRQRTGVPLDREAEDRLRRTLARRLAWPAFGRVVGYLTLLGPVVALTDDVDPPPSVGMLVGWTVVAAGMTAGGLVAQLGVGLRSSPPSSGAVRTARAGARLTRDYVATLRLRAWSWSCAALAASIALDAVVVPGRLRAPAAAVVLGLEVGTLVLAGASWVVIRALLDRPLPSGSREELRWREAVLADSLQQIVTASLGAAVVAAVLGLGSVFQLWHRLAIWQDTVGLLVGVGLVGITATAAWTARTNPQPPALQEQGVSA